MRDGLGAQLHRGLIAVVACVGADLARLVAQEKGVVRLGNEDNDEHPEHEIPDEEHVVRPPPLRVLVDEAADEGAKNGADEGRGCENHHGRLQVVARVEIVYAAASYGEEGGAREAVEEARNENGGHILGDGGGYEPNDEECERDQIDGTSAIELGERREQHRPAAKAKDEEGQPDCGYDPAGVEFG